MRNEFLQEQLTAATMLQITETLKLINSELPFMISLTPTERRYMPSIADRRLPYVYKLVEYAGIHRAKIGMTQEYLDELLQYASFFDALTEIFNLVDGLTEGLRDTRLQVGATLFRHSRAGHKLIAMASEKGRPGLQPILNDLDALFSKQGRRKSKPQSALPATVD